MPDFPRTVAAPPALCPALSAQGLSLRSAESGDVPFLRDLFAGFRAAELALVPWSPEQKRAFLDDQFRLQHLHFTRFHAAADFWLLLRTLPPRAPQPIGRLYLDRSAQAWHIVDIGLLRDVQGQGVGSRLLAWIQTEAAAAGASVTLQVAANNPRAHALYMRLGFRNAGEGSATHQPMVWRAPFN